MAASSVRVVFVALLVATLTSCRSTWRADAVALAVRGAETGERLAVYYDSLARDTIDHWELTAFRRGFLRLPPADVDARREFEAQYRALRSRARLARRLGNVYEAYGRLAKYDTGGEIVAAIDSLDEQLREVAESPLDRRGDIADRLIKVIADWKQKRELRSAGRLLAAATAGVDELFRAERELYRDIVRDRAGNYRQVAKELVEAKEVVSVALVDRVLSSFNLEWPASKVPFDDERTIAGIKEIIDARATTFEAQSQSETDAVARALRTLLEAHD